MIWGFLHLSALAGTAADNNAHSDVCNKAEVFSLTSLKCWLVFMMYGVLSVLSTFIQPWPRNSLQRSQWDYVHDSEDDLYMMQHKIKYPTLYNIIKLSSTQPSLAVNDSSFFVIAVKLSLWFFPNICFHCFNGENLLGKL